MVLASEEGKESGERVEWSGKKREARMTEE